MKRFIKTSKNFNFNNPKKGIIIASCLDNRSEIFVEFCRQSNKLTNSKSLAIFTNRRIYNEYKNESKDFKSIIIEVPLSNNLLEKLCLKGWNMIRKFDADSIDNLLHNSQCAFKLDRHIKGSLRNNLDYEKGLSLIAGIIYPYIQKFSRDILENSIYITEGTTFVDIVLSNLLENLGIKTIVFGPSRIPNMHTLIHKDIFESNFINENSNPIDINKNNLNKRVDYSHDFIPSFKLINQGKIIKGLKQSFISGKRIIKEFLIFNDTFNRPSLKGIFNKYIGIFFNPAIKFIIGNIQNYYPKVDKNDLIFYTHISPERSVDIFSSLPVEVNQIKLLKELCKLSRKLNKVFILIHPDEFKASNLLLFVFLHIKYSHVFLITKNDKFSNSNFVATISGTIILERALKGFYTFHSSDTYFSKLLPSYKYFSACHLITLMNTKIDTNKSPDLELINKFKNLIPSDSIEGGYLYEYPLNKKLIKKLIKKIWLKV